MRPSAVTAMTISLLLLLAVANACEECDIADAEKRADRAVTKCFDVWNECDRPETRAVERCQGDPPGFLCSELAAAGLCKTDFSDALPDHRDILPPGMPKQMVWRHCPMSCSRCARDDARAESERGHALKEAGEIDAAAQAFRRAVELQSWRPDHHRNLAALTSNATEAAECVARAVELERPRPPDLMPPRPSPCPRPSVQPARSDNAPRTGHHANVARGALAPPSVAPLHPQAAPLPRGNGGPGAK